MAKQLFKKTTTYQEIKKFLLDTIVEDNINLDDNRIKMGLESLNKVEYSTEFLDVVREIGASVRGKNIKKNVVTTILTTAIICDKYKEQIKDYSTSSIAILAQESYYRLEEQPLIIQEFLNTYTDETLKHICLKGKDLDTRCEYFNILTDMVQKSNVKVTKENKEKINKSFHSKIAKFSQEDIDEYYKQVYKIDYAKDGIIL